MQIPSKSKITSCHKYKTYSQKSKSSKKRRDYVKKRLYFVGKYAKVDNI